MINYFAYFFLQLPISLPEGRHSHVAINLRFGLLIIGGLTSEMKNTSFPLILKYDEWSISSYEICDIVNRR